MTSSTTPVLAADLPHLHRCIELAAKALDAGDEPFGSLLLSADGQVLFEDRNRVSGGDNTRHPELTIVEWAVANLSPTERAAATVYTSGEHCPMCSAAHAWVGLGRIVYASSGEQLIGWLSEWQVPDAPVTMIPITVVAPGIEVSGPVPELADEVRSLHQRLQARR